MKLREFKKNGLIEDLLLQGKKVDESSTIYSIKFKQEPYQKFQIYGEATIIQNNTRISSFELIQEMEQFFNDELRSSTVKSARYHKKTGKLEICFYVNSGILEIHSEPELSSGGESWQYDDSKNISTIY